MPTLSILEQHLKKRILCLDGATGTALQRHNLTNIDFGGQQFDGCNEHLVLTRPDLITLIHEQYLEAGADIIETNSFGSTSIVLSEYGLENNVSKLNMRAAQLAREAADKYATAEKPRFVAGAIGPTSKSICITGGVDFNQLQKAFCEQAISLIEGGVDYLLLETMQDTLNLKAACIGCLEACVQTGRSVPFAISVTIEPGGTMLAGQNIEALYTAISHFPLLYVGLNCATGPNEMRPHIEKLAHLATCGVSCVPNAGLPNELGMYLETPKDFADKLATFMQDGLVNIVGGCCGTRPEHIKEVVKQISCKPRTPRHKPLPSLSGLDIVHLEKNKLFLIGERSNVIGSRKFKRLISEDKFAEAVDIGRGQAAGGAHIIDVCLANPDRDEKLDMQTFLARATGLIKPPLMIDSTDPQVIEAGLQWCQGKGVVNSINLEQGEVHFHTIVPIIKKYGAAIVVGTIDEINGMALTRDAKLAIAKRSIALLANDIPASDIIIDPLVFPVATGDEKYATSGLETIEGIRLIHTAFPECQMTLGLSNISFGLPTPARRAVNTVFLYHCKKAGLNTVIINTEQMGNIDELTNKERQLCEDLILARIPDPISPLVRHYRGVQPAPTTPVKQLPVQERLIHHIVTGSRTDLHDTLHEAMQEIPPLTIINKPLMAGMGEVGRLFNRNERIVAEVLQSAEVMKASVDYLTPYMDAQDIKCQGTMVLATVKGDVHDIGKNLVDIILGNNGYNIIDLGIKVPAETIVQAVIDHHPDYLGLSGLLVRSGVEMAAVVTLLEAKDITLPIFIGGAALSEKFIQRTIRPLYSGAVYYAKDPMTCLSQLPNCAVAPQPPSTKQKTIQQQKIVTPNKQPTIIPPCPPPDLDRHEVTESVAEIFKFVNPTMLFGKHLGYRGFKKAFKGQEPKATELYSRVLSCIKELQQNQDVNPKGVYQFFKAQPTSQDTILCEKQSIDAKANPVSLARYLNPKGDYIGILVVTAGHEIVKRAHWAKEQGEYLTSHIYHALALELAEGLAEKLHQEIRVAWFAEPTKPPEALFSATYRGRRYAPGYAALPHENQQVLFNLLQPETIGVTLSENLMMEPEASVSCVIIHHPEAKY